MIVEKRDGRKVEFNKQKIVNAILKAMNRVDQIDLELANKIADSIERTDKPLHVEDIQNMIENKLMSSKLKDVAREYITYRQQRTEARDGKSYLMQITKAILKEVDRDNANISNSPSAKMLQIASATSKQYYLNNVISKEFSKAHKEGLIHIHDLDFYGKCPNCLQIPLDKLLENGFNTGYGFIRPAKRISTLGALSAIIMQSNQNDMYGGQSFPHFDKSFARAVRRLNIEDDNVVEEEIKQAMQGLVYNLNSMHSRAGAQVTFSSINIGTDTTNEGRWVIKYLLQALEEGLGRGETAIFPNLVFRTKKDINLYPGTPNYDLFQYAVKVASVRMNPTFSFMDSSFNQKYGDEVSYMGCRTRTIGNVNGEEISEGRGNVAPCTMNLPRLALKTKGDIYNKDLNDFFKKFDKLIDLVIRQLVERYNVVKNLKVNDMPFLMGQHIYMNSDHLTDQDTIEDAVKNGSLAVGFVGLAECLKGLIGKHHAEDEEALNLGIKIIKFIFDKCEEAKQQYQLNFVAYATPAESTCGKSIKDREDFGLIEGVTDKDYYTNSYHVPVYFKLGIVDKVKIEGNFQKLCPGGHISYVELNSNAKHNPQAIEQIVQYMAECDLGYAGINYPIDECKQCGNNGLIPAKCPICGSDNIRRIRRITGYLSEEAKFNDSKKAELRDRLTHN